MRWNKEIGIGKNIENIIVMKKWKKKDKEKWRKERKINVEKIELIKEKEVRDKKWRRIKEKGKNKIDLIKVERVDERW